jgi:very-short-patch-repair endonuclease
MELATRQHGVVSTRQLALVGYTRSSASKANKVHRLDRIHRGVYAVGHRRLTWHGRCMAALLASEAMASRSLPSVVASHYSAAWLWGISRSRPTRFDVTAPTRRRGKREFRVHFALLAHQDRGVCEGIPVTSLPRTLLDLAATSRPGQLDRYLERAEERKLLDLRAVEATLGRAGGHRGRGRLRRALAIYRPEPAFTRSSLERRFLKLVRQAGLPIPSTNFAIGAHELDAYWEPERFAVELDVYETHGTRAAFERDRLRQEDLKLAGIEMIRVTGPRLDREPDAVMGRVATLLERRREELR